MYSCMQAHVFYVVRHRPVDMQQQSDELIDHLAANATPEEWATAALNRLPLINCIIYKYQPIEQYVLCRLDTMDG